MNIVVNHVRYSLFPASPSVCSVCGNKGRKLYQESYRSQAVCMACLQAQLNHKRPCLIPTTKRQASDTIHADNGHGLPLCGRGVESSKVAWEPCEGIPTCNRCIRKIKRDTK